MIKSSPTLADVNFAFAAALDDIIAKGRQSKAVVVFPAESTETFTVESTLPRNWRSVKELIQELFAQNVVVVTGAGNNAEGSPTMNTLPAMWWNLERDFPLIVVGAATQRGDMASWSQGKAALNEVVWAPGQNVVCADGPASQGLVVRSGTSFAAAMVSKPTHVRRCQI